MHTRLKQTEHLERGLGMRASCRQAISRATPLFLLAVLLIGYCRLKAGENLPASAEAHVSRAKPSTPSVAWTAPRRSAGASYLFRDQFESCTYQGKPDVGTYGDVWAGTTVSKLNPPTNGAIVKQGNCSIRRDPAGPYGFGKVVPALSAPADEVWITSWVYFQGPWKRGRGGVGDHLWRAMASPSVPGWEMNLSLQGRGDSIQMYNIANSQAPLGAKGADTCDAVPWSSCNIYMDFQISKNMDRWMCWEWHIKLNSAGKSDGVAEFFIDGVKLGGLHKRPLRGSSSNVHVGATHAISNTVGWNYFRHIYLDDYSVSTVRIGCSP